MALRVNRTEQRRQAREQEANTMNELLHDNSAPSDWNELSPIIEDVLHELSEKDRHAILLRFFQNKTLSEVGAGLNLTENAARMRVDRALENLRGKLARRGITTTASALASLVSINAVQAAPVGFAATVCTAALTSSTVPVSTLIAATKTIAMTTLQKTMVAASLAIAAGTGFYAVHQNSQLRAQIQALKQERAPLDSQIQTLERERDQATQQLAALKDEAVRLKTAPSAAELLKLRGQVGVLRQQATANQTKAAPPTSGLAKMMSDPAMKQYLRQAQMDKMRSFYTDLFKELKLTPEQTDKFLQLSTDAASKALDKYTGNAPGTSEQTSTDPFQDLGSQLQSLLGETGFARYREFSEELPARSTINLLESQLGEHALDDSQKARLLQVVKAEPAELTMGMTGAPDKAFMGSQAEIDGFLKKVTESNKRILQHSAQFLTTEQAATLETVLANSIDTRKLQAAALIQKR
jgi:hypothetical protein